MSDSEQSFPLQETKKRRIGDVESSLEPEAITRVPDLWFDDGNIILQAETKQFRVHRAHISVHSPTFADMYILPHSERESTVEGCPVIHLPDRAEDWENLLMAMYNVFKTHRLQKEYPISRVLSLLRLGGRYRFDYFRDVGAECLRTAVPITYEKWLGSASHIADITDTDEDSFTKGFEFDLVNAALEVRMLSILPALCFICLRDRKMTEILEGITREDGTRSILPRDIQNRIISARESITPYAITQAVIEPLLLLEQARNTKAVLCKNSACRLSSKLEAVYDRILLIASTPGGALQSTEKLCQCESCNGFVIRKMREGRQAIWQRLPSDFGLPAWGEAKDFDDE